MDVLRQFISSPSATGAGHRSACCSRRIELIKGRCRRARVYGRHCTRADGALKTYEEVLAGMTNFLTRTQGLDERVVRGAVVEMMARQPAWRKV